MHVSLEALFMIVPIISFPYNWRRRGHTQWLLPEDKQVCVCSSFVLINKNTHSSWSTQNNIKEAEWLLTAILSFWISENQRENTFSFEFCHEEHNADNVGIIGFLKRQQKFPLSKIAPTGFELVISVMSVQHTNYTFSHVVAEGFFLTDFR